MNDSNNNIIELNQFITPKKNSERLKLRRFVAFGIDIFLISLIKLCVSLIFQSFVASNFSQMHPEYTNNLVQNMGWFDWSITMIIFGGYFFISHLLLDDQTIGKKIMNLKVVPAQFLLAPTIENSYLSVHQVWRRTAAYYVGYFTFGMTFCLAFIRKDEKNITDFFSQCMVISQVKYELLLSGDSAEVIMINVDELSKVA